MTQPIFPPSPIAPPPPPELFPQHPLSHGNTDVDSDDSLEIIEMDSVLPSGTRLEEDIRRDWVNRRGVEFPAPPRGRTKSRGVVEYDSEQEHSPPTTPKKRHLSLSPLRTLFPYRPMNIPDRAMSAHPSPNPSPYSYSRSSFPFLSTTSLKMSMSTSSFLRLPLTTTSSATSERHESFLTRTLSSFKGKERERHESLDAWEVIESEPEPLILPLDEPSSPRLKSSPTRSQSFSYGSPVDTIRAIDTVTISPPSSTNSPHPLSLRDRKAPPVPFVKRPKQRPAPPPPAPTPLADPVPIGPVLTSVRTRKPPPPPPKKKPQAIASSPLGADSWRPDDDPETGTSIFKRALTIPLPLTPVDTSRFDYETITRASAIHDDVHPPVVSSVPPSVPRIPLNEPQSPYRSPFDELSELIDQPYARRDLGNSRPWASMPTSPLVYSQIPEPGPSTSRRHYPGRPLPRPPGTTRALVDSTYAGHGDSTIDDVRIDVQCPEGLLIDLDDTSLMGHSGTSTPQTDRSHIQTSAPPSSASSTEFLGLVTDSTIASNYESSNVSTPTAVLPASAQFSEFTDLDVLVSRLNEERRNGADYDVRPQISLISPHASL